MSEHTRITTEQYWRDVDNQGRLATLRGYFDAAVPEFDLMDAARLREELHRVKRVVEGGKLYPPECDYCGATEGLRVLRDPITPGGNPALTCAECDEGEAETAGAAA